MKKIGLIGGTTWLSTIEYYTFLNKIVNERLGSDFSADLVIRSVNFEDYRILAEKGEWNTIGKKLLQIAKELQSIGAGAIALCANTTHRTADFIKESIDVPLLHIGDAMSAELLKMNSKTTGLIGTIYTMQSQFIPDKLKEKGINTIVPDKKDMALLNRIIFDELTKGIFKDETKQKILEVLDKLKEKGADSIILGCTEFPLIIKESDTDLPLLNSTLVHSKYIVDFALKSID
jgi:aspartate racemase